MALGAQCFCTVKIAMDVLGTGMGCSQHCHPAVVPASSTRSFPWRAKLGTPRARGDARVTPTSVRSPIEPECWRMSWRPSVLLPHPCDPREDLLHHKQPYQHTPCQALTRAHAKHGAGSRDALAALTMAAGSTAFK